MLVQRAYIYRLMPTPEQEGLFRQYAGACRWVYNQGVALNEQRRKDGDKRLHYVQLQKELTRWRHDPASAWLGELPCGYQQAALRDLDRGYVNLFEKRAQAPTFKKKRVSRDSFKAFAPFFAFDGGNRRLRVPGAGWIRFRKDRLPAGEVKNITVSRVGRHWQASVQVELEVAAPVHPSTTPVGVDLGVAKFAALSTGQVIRAPVDRLLELERRMKRAQRRLARKVKFSANWKKQRARITSLHRRITNVRVDFLHKTTTAICKSHALVVVEDLEVQSMSKSARGTVNAPGRNVRAKAGLNRSILRQGWAEFRRQLDYKQRWLGGTVLAVDPRNTSRRCPECGHVSAENRVAQAVFACVACGHQADADVNAARNILTAARYAVAACGGPALSGGPMKQEPPPMAAA